MRGALTRGLSLFLLAWPSLAWSQSEPERLSGSLAAEAEKLLREGEEAYRQHHWDKSENDFRAAIALREKALGQTHPTLAADLNKFAWVLAARGKLDEAEAQLRRVLTIRETTLGAEHASVASTCTDLALLLARTENLKEAVPLLLRAHAIRRKCFGPENPETAKSLYLLATFALMVDPPDPAEAAARLLDQAERYLKQALAIQEKTLGTEHLDVAATLEALANVEARRKQWDAAEKRLKRVLEIREKRLAPDDPELANTIDAYVSYLSAGHQDRRTKKEVESLTARSKAIRLK
ncbi:tetratricopeptide repeat protein [Singulisphaera sp. PoT]|uniref:tetratricopeptide repeat protein n=1 Tax=Singulisphaera sp. PoT TaxID=3411797 RepID=UPI003BF5ACF7